MNLHAQIEEGRAVLHALLGHEATIARIAATMCDALRGGQTVYLCGNGGSAAEAQHFATELVGRYVKSRRALPGVALTADGTLLTCLLNDYPPELIFARQLEGLARPGDLLVVLSTSGRSPNILAVLRTARELGIRSIALLGRDGGPALPLADIALVVPSMTTARIQEAHLFLIHAICEVIDAQVS